MASDILLADRCVALLMCCNGHVDGHAVAVSKQNVHRGLGKLLDRMHIAHQIFVPWSRAAMSAASCAMACRGRVGLGAAAHGLCLNLPQRRPCWPCLLEALSRRTRSS